MIMTTDLVINYNYAWVDLLIRWFDFFTTNYAKRVAMSENGLILPWELFCMVIMMEKEALQKPKMYRLIYRRKNP